MSRWLRLSSAGFTLLAAIVVPLAGCAQELPATMPVKIINDTNGQVEIVQCNSTCRHSEETDLLDPGQTVTVNTSAEDVDNWWYFIAPGQHPSTGCFDLLYRTYVANATRALSHSVRCPANLV